MWGNRDNARSRDYGTILIAPKLRRALFCAKRQARVKERVRGASECYPFIGHRVRARRFLNDF